MKIARIALGSGTANALNASLRRAILRQFQAHGADETVSAILLTSSLPVFLTSADQTDDPAAGPTLAELCKAVEASARPVIAVIAGEVSGDGLELTAATHYRVADQSAVFAMPGMALGLLPSGGGAQRLTRLAGPKRALDLMLGLQTLSAQQALAVGLVDELAEGEVLPVAQAAAVALAVGQKQPRAAQLTQAHLRDPAGFRTAIAAARAGDPPPSQAARRLIDCVEAAQLLPFEAGLSFEQVAAEEVRSLPEARAAMHLARAEERVSGALEPAPRQVARIALTGPGAGAAGWAAGALKAGIPVALSIEDDGPRAALRAEIDTLLMRAREQGALPPGAGLQPQDDPSGAALVDADLVLLGSAAEAARAGALAGPDCILALMLEAGQDPELSALGASSQVLGLRAAGAARGARTAELVHIAGADAAATLQTVASFAALTGRVPLATPTGEGGIGAAVWGACILATREMVSAGTSRGAIDNALRAAGFSLLPFGGAAAALDAASSPVSPDEIILRCEAAMANAGALLVSAGIAASPADVDLAMVHGFGYPKKRGGPMFAADLTGLLPMRNFMRGLEEEDAGLWTPAPLLDDLIKNGRHFSDLNG